MTEVGLQFLPSELLHSIQLYALSEHFPATSRHIQAAFYQTGASFCSRYLLGRVLSQGVQDKATILTKILRYPICTEDVVKHLMERLPEGIRHVKASKFDVPRRLFRSLAPDTEHINWEKDPRFAFLQYLLNSPGIPDPNLNSFDGYALTKAVHARYVPLVRLLLKHGADPQRKNCLAIFVAIRQQDLTLVKLLIERDDSPYTELPGIGKRKRRKFEDRVIANAAMLRAAVKCGAKDIIDYLSYEKGCVPDIPTLRLMTTGIDR